MSAHRPIERKVLDKVPASVHVDEDAAEEGVVGGVCEVQGADVGGDLLEFGGRA